MKASLGPLRIQGCSGIAGVVPGTGPTWGTATARGVHSMDSSSGRIRGTLLLLILKRDSMMEPAADGRHRHRSNPARGRRDLHVNKTS